MWRYISLNIYAFDRNGEHLFAFFDFRFQLRISEQQSLKKTARPHPCMAYERYQAALAELNVLANEGNERAHRFLDTLNHDHLAIRTAILDMRATVVDAIADINAGSVATYERPRLFTLPPPPPDLAPLGHRGQPAAAPVDCR